MNLKEFLTKYSKVQVPALQRDYAQGRKSKESVAKEFLDAIFSVLLGKKENLHIDFIFGYKDSSDTFLLIDGQQRITTLWLLHFYIYKKADIKECEFLGHFSYAVRKSSKNFCKNLLKSDFDLDTLPSKAIADNEGAFEDRENLRNDPTIKAMLNMLDLIYERLGEDFHTLAENLNRITFSEFDMEAFSLGEELYVKMNARGKQLSKYENLKAFIEKGEGVKRDIEILSRIDNAWSDYFFNASEFADTTSYAKDSNQNSFDEKGLNFLHYANLFFKLEAGKIKEAELKEIIDEPSRAIDEFYAPLQNIENIKLLDNFIEMCLWYKDLALLKSKDSAFFKGKNMGYVNLCHFLALLHYVRQTSDIKNKQSLKDYLRVCRHLIENHTLDRAIDVPMFFRIFKELAKGSDDIYRFLCDYKPQTPSIMLDLEIKKARLIIDFRDGRIEDNWEEILDRTSDDEVLVGRVDFLLDFSDEKFKYESYENNPFYSETEYSSKSKYQNPNFQRFCKYANLTMQILDKERFLNANLALFQRAFLSVGNYGFYATNYFYGNVPVDIYRDREAMNWLLSGVRNDEAMPYFARLLDLLLVQAPQKDLASKMQDIINDCDLSSKEWWEQLLIKQEGLFKFLNEKTQPFQKTRRIYFWQYTKQVVLLNKTKVTYNQKYAKDLLTYGFYLYLKNLGFNVSTYDEEAVIYDYPQDSKANFSVNGVSIICNSEKSHITIDKQKFRIDLEGDIFKEFERIAREIR